MKLHDRITKAMITTTRPIIIKKRQTLTDRIFVIGLSTAIVILALWHGTGPLKAETLTKAEAMQATFVTPTAPASANDNDRTILHLKRREYLAGMALEGLLSQPRTDNAKLTPAVAAELATVYADELCKRLDK